MGQGGACGLPPPPVETPGLTPRQVTLLMLLRCVRQAVPVMPVMYNWYEEAGLGVADVFLVTSVSSSLGMIFEIPSGWVADRLGRVRVLAVSLALLAASYLALLFVRSWRGWVWAGVVLKALSSALFSGTDVALLHETVRELELRSAHAVRTQNVAAAVQRTGLRQESRQVSAIILTEAACYVLGSVLAARWGLQTVLVASVLPPLVGVAVCLHLVEPTPVAGRNNEPAAPSRASCSWHEPARVCRGAAVAAAQSIRDCKELFYPPAAVPGARPAETAATRAQLFRLSLLASLTYFTMWLNPILWKEHDFHVSANGVLMSAISVAAACGSLACPYIMNRAAHDSAVVMSCLCVLVGACYSMFAGGPWWVMLGNVLLGLARGVMWPLSVTMVNRLVGERDDIRSGALSFYAALMKGVQIVAGPLFGHAIEAYGAGQSCTAIAAVVALLAL
eukprot:TRINITY_DN2027_c0_g1_i1.p1 TRINITY_DN2027_c0_g1~~TRINITY_DN2027_c0_g1_i1.p1  ORF type:complete len:483 (+),score=129.46 TRINITY_DN2027_c0_g1_i1:104-1450(+)